MYQLDPLLLIQRSVLGHEPKLTMDLVKVLGSRGNHCFGTQSVSEQRLWEISFNDISLTRLEIERFHSLSLLSSFLVKL